MEIKNITDEAFAKYGRVVNDVSFAGLVDALGNVEITENTVYEPSVAELEKAMRDTDRNILFGEADIQIGYCGGHNQKLNAVEYHRSSEINVAATDAILLLGSRVDVTDTYSYDTGLMEAFLVPEGMAVELYATTLHYAPCGVDGAGFMVGIILPKGTNYPLAKEHRHAGEDMLLAAQNKWLIGHPDADLPDGTWLGLTGENLEV